MMYPSFQKEIALGEIPKKLWKWEIRKMEHIFEVPARRSSLTNEESAASGPAYEAYRILHVAFTIAPIVAGLDKFFNLLVNWEQYLPPVATKMLGGHGHEFMLVVGVIEIIAGLGVAFKPKVFAYVVSLWLLLIVVNLLLIPGYFDVALRDFGLALGALALARLSGGFDK
jgi:hypothetical protein